MDLENRINALFAWMDEPASAGFGSEAARRVLGKEKAAAAQQAQEEWVPDMDSGETPASRGEITSEPASRPEGRSAMQAEYDIAALRREFYGQNAVCAVRSTDLTRAEDPWQAQKPAAMTAGQLDLLLRSKWGNLSERQRAEMTALQQCGHVPDPDMDLFLYAVSTLSEFISSREVNRLLEQIKPRTEKSDAWKAVHDALKQRLAISDMVSRKRIDQAEEQLRMRQEAYRQAAEAYSRAQADRRNIENSYF